MIERTIEPIWQGGRCIVAATGYSLTVDVAAACRQARQRGGYRVIAISDAYRLMPWADVLYSCDGSWWKHHKPQFSGAKWSAHDKTSNDKRRMADEYGLNIVRGADKPGFSLFSDQIHYGKNSGFQAVNLAILFGAVRIVLVGFNLQGRHFFGDHPKQLNRSARYESFVPPFVEAAKQLPAGIEIVNATVDSALRCFPMMPLEDAIELRTCAA